MDIIPISSEILELLDETHSMTAEDIRTDWAMPSYSEYFSF